MKRTSICLALLALLLTTSLLWAESQARIVRLSLVDGSVELDRASGQGFEKAIQNMPITQGMRLRTGGGSNAEVEFESGSTLRLIGNTSISFGRLSLSSNGDKLTAVNVEEGTAYFNVKKKGHDEFAVSFAGREVRVTEPSHLRVDVSESRAEVSMFKGEAELAEDHNVHIKKDQTLAFDRPAEGQDASDKSPYDVAQGVTDEPSDRWDTDREKVIDSYAQQNRVVNSPYEYGMSDLAQYGSYYSDPAYGWVWRPYGVNYAWDPYNNGAWVYYPAYGYTWVSSNPWGWTPYRHGRWVFLPAYGWVWQPGYWNNWWRGPVVVNPPARYYPPHPPRDRDHHVVWVGNPQPGGHDRDRDRGQVTTQTHDRDEAGRREKATVNATAPGGNKAAVPAEGFAGNGTDNMIVTTSGDRDHVGTGRDPVSGHPIRVVRDRDNSKDRDRDRDNKMPASAAVGTGTPATGPAKSTVTPQPTPGQPRVDPHHDTPRPQHNDASRSTPPAQSRQATPSAPRMSTPSAPHMEGPHMSGGSHQAGGNRSPK